MFEPGEKVVCINDTFEPVHRAIYKSLPTKDEIYTVRSCTIGRTRTGGSDKGVSYLVYLVELINGPDPYMHDSTAEELGFRSDRFAPLIDITESEEAEIEELIPVTSPR